jgi:sulfur carrier protein
VRVLVNGAVRELPDGSTVSALVAALGAGDRGVAVAIGDEVVPRSAWETTALDEGWRVEVLTAVQGG